MQNVISKNVVASSATPSRNDEFTKPAIFKSSRNIRYAAEITEASDTSSSSAAAPQRRHMARGLLLSSFSDGLVPNPEAIDFLMESLVESMWNHYLQELQEKVESSALASPCCGPTDVDSVNQLLDNAMDGDTDGDCDSTTSNEGEEEEEETNNKLGAWKIKFQKLVEMQKPKVLELRFLYIPTAMYALRKDSTNSPGKQRQRARADGKKRRTQIAQLVQDQFAQAHQEMNNDDDSESPQPVNVLTVSFDFDDGSLKQPEGSKDASRFPSTGMEALNDWKPHLIYVQGGNTFWLYHCMEKGNWKDALVDSITGSDDDTQSPAAVYCGTSAGAILAGSRMETATWKEWDDPTVVPDRPNYQDWKTVAGLDLAGENVSVFPHMGERWQDMVDGKIEQLKADYACTSMDSSSSAPEIHCLRDEQMLCVNGSGLIPTRTLLECEALAEE